MAKATEAQVRALEAAHKNQFMYLMNANRLWLQMSKDYAWLPNTDPRKQTMLNYGKKIAPLIAKWSVRQEKLEKAGIPRMPVKVADFFTRARLPYLETIEAQITGKKLSGLGWVVVLLWVVLGVIAAFKAEEIFDEMNTTAEEKTELMDSTAKACKDLNLSAEDCKKLISQTQKETTEDNKGGIFGNITTILLLVGGGFLAKEFLFNKQQRA